MLSNFFRIVTEHFAQSPIFGLVSGKCSRAGQWLSADSARIRDFNHARSRRRSGMPQVSFSVDAQGRVSNVTLLVRSGTASLDREAVAVVSRAQPLPPPPPEMLQQWAVRVTMPIDFNLAELNARR